MCGRFTLTINFPELREYFPDKWLADDDLHSSANYNIAPTNMVTAIINARTPSMCRLRWGLIPSWWEEVGRRSGLINARSETVDEKPSFRQAFRRRRCLIPADGFYEWRLMSNGEKQPVYVRLETEEVFAFAGLWECNSRGFGSGGDEIYSCTILTTKANELLRPIHNRMPVILPVDDYEAWLETEESDPFVLQRMMRPYPATGMSAYVVDGSVNNPRNNSPACIRPTR
ncbi:MAG: SOS response-associated peptidase [Anaerolineales bacterium]|nr:SOS response-associated peptidase [Anaerolineales bacterium]